MKIAKYILPACWASALINGDESGLDNRALEALNDWEAGANPAGGLFSACDVGEPEFRYSSPDCDCLGGDYAEYTFLVDPDHPDAEPDA